MQRGRATKEYVGTVKYAAQLVKAHGAFSLTRGLAATAIREAPAYGAFYGVYFTLKRHLVQTYPDASEFMHQVPAAMLAAVGYWTACYPLDVSKV